MFGISNNFSSKYQNGLIYQTYNRIFVKVSLFDLYNRILKKWLKSFNQEQNEKWMEVILGKMFFDHFQCETLSDDAQILCEEILKYITENRLENVISKREQ